MDKELTGVEKIQKLINDQINLGDTKLVIGILVDSHNNVTTYWNGVERLSTVLGALESCRFDIYAQLFAFKSDVDAIDK